MKKIQIPKWLQSCITLDLFERSMFDQVNEATITPGMKKSLAEISKHFFDELDKIAKENKTESFFKEGEWVHCGYAMSKGNYVKIGDIVHLIVPVF